MRTLSVGVILSILLAALLAGCGGSRAVTNHFNAPLSHSLPHVRLAQLRACLEQHGWSVERVSRNEIDSPHGAVVWDMEFKHARLVSVGWTGATKNTGPEQSTVVRHCLWQTRS